MRAGATVGEWAGALREVFGEYRAPTGVSGVAGVAEAGAELAAVRERVRQTGEELGTRLRFLVGKPGLDGHSNGAEQIAVRARDAGFEVVYQGIRLTPAQIVAAAVAEDVHCVGLSILSGSHMELVPDVQKAMAAAGIGDVPLIVGGIIPESDARKMEAAGVAAVFTPKDFGMTDDHGSHRRRDPQGQRPPHLDREWRRCEVLRRRVVHICASRGLVCASRCDAGGGQSACRPAAGWMRDARRAGRTQAARPADVAATRIRPSWPHGIRSSAADSNTSAPLVLTPNQA